MKCTSIVILFSITFAVRAQGQENIQPVFFSILTTNIDSSVSWYQKHFEFQVVDRTKNEERGFEIVNLERTNLKLEIVQTSKTLNSEKVLENQEAGSRLSGFFKFGFQVEKFEEYISDLSKNGAIFHGNIVMDPVSNKKMIIVLDPDGNRIQFFEK